MSRNFLCTSCVILIISCSGYFNDHFFDFLFNSKDINITGQCSVRPSLFSEGRFIEVYSMSNVNVQLTVKKISDKASFHKSRNYPRYKIPDWRRTPVVNKSDSVYSFIHNEISDEINSCFNESTLKRVLIQEGNYYTFLYDDLGRIKLFIWDVKEQKLFLLSSYEV